MPASADMYRSAMTSKELNGLMDHVKNEAVLTHLCKQAALECASPQLRSFFAHQAEVRCQNLEDLNETLHKYAGFGH